MTSPYASFGKLGGREGRGYTAERIKEREEEKKKGGINAIFGVSM